MVSFSRVEAVELVKKAKHDVISKNRRYHLKVFEDCFLGKDLVLWIQENIHLDENEAIEYGRVWQEEYKYFEHVTFEHPLKNENYFYRWIDERKIARKTSLETNTFVPLENNNANLHEGIWLDFENGISEIFPFLNIESIVYNLFFSPSAIVVKKRFHFGKYYQDSFLGSQVVDWMEDKLMLTRPESILLGQYIMQMGYIKSVVNSKGFCDSDLVYSIKSELKENIKSSFEDKTFGFDIDGKPVLLNYCIKQLLKNDCYKTKGIFRLSLDSALVDRLVLFLSCFHDGGLSLMKYVKSMELPLLYAQIIKSFYSKMEHPPIPSNFLEEYELNDIKESKNKIEIVMRISSEIKNLPNSAGLLKCLSLLHKVGRAEETFLGYSELAKLFTPLLFSIESNDLKKYILETEKVSTILTIFISELLTIYGPKESSPGRMQLRTSDRPRRKSPIKKVTRKTERFLNISEPKLQRISC